MSDKITFELDGKSVEASADETIWQVAKRSGTTIPHLCYHDAPGYRADGNCRACVVEVEGERVLAASCIRKPAPGMKVKTATERATKGRAMADWGCAQAPAGTKVVRLEEHDLSATKGTFALVLIFLACFAVYYFANWKALADVWPVS